MADGTQIDLSRNAPDVAVEIVSPTDRAQNITDKASNYVNAGTLLWYVYPEDQEVKVYEAGQPIKTLGMEDVLGKVLPGFKLALKDIFPADE